jgi:hypothetical protein
MAYNPGIVGQSIPGQQFSAQVLNACLLEGSQSYAAVDGPAPWVLAPGISCHQAARIAPAGDKVRRVAEDECAANRTVAQPAYPHLQPAFTASQPSGMTMRDPHGCAGLRGLFHGVAGKLLTMDVKNIVIP